MRHVLGALCLGGLAPQIASAGVIDDISVGVLQHNICVLDCDNADKEDGPDISAEVAFASPGWLGFAASPKPYIAVTANAAGNTSFVAAGLQWEWAFADGWSFQPGLGYALHDGEKSFPFPQGDPHNDPISAETVFFGSRDLFRTSLAINRDLGERWGAQLHYEHFSHGQILGTGRNQGIDNLGVRLRYRYGG